MPPATLSDCDYQEIGSDDELLFPDRFSDHTCPIMVALGRKVANHLKLFYYLHRCFAIRQKRTRQKNPFSFSRKSRREKSQKTYAKGFCGGTQRADLPARRRGLLTAPLELGSRQFVKSHQTKRPGICLVFYFALASQCLFLCHKHP